MGSASKGKRIASGPVGGKAKHARIGMSLVHSYNLSSSTPASIGHEMRWASAAPTTEGGTLFRG